MNALVFTLLDIAGLIEKRFDRPLAGARGVSFREYRLLKSLSEFPGSRAMRVELAEAVGLTPSAVTRALKPLEKLGYVVTEKGERDARQSLARLTEAGEILLADADAIVADVVAGLPAMSISEGQLAELHRGLAGPPASRSVPLRAAIV